MKKNYLRIFTLLCFLPGFFISCKHNVKIVVLEKIVVESKPNKTEYFEGESFESDGISVNAYYSDDTTKDVTSEIKYSGFDSSKKQKNQTVIVNYQGFTDFFYVNINPIDIIELKITPPKKLTYFIGEKINLEGLSVTAKYNNGTTADVSDKIEIKGFDSSKPENEQRVTVEYDGKSATFTVKINNIVLKKIKITKTPSKKEYAKYENLNLDGLEVIAEYDNNTTQNITNSQDLVISFFDSTTAGQKTITLTYGGKTVSFDVTVKAAELSSIEIESKPTKLNYFTDDLIDFTGMVVKAKYDDGSEIDVTDMIEISGTKSTSKIIDVYKPLSDDGKITIRVKYGDKTADFTIDVEINYVKSLTVIKSPFKESYYPIEMVEIGDFELLAEYLNGKKETIKEKNPNLIIKFENKKAIKCDIGTNTVVIQYKTQTTSVTFEVIEDAVTKLEILNELKQKTFGKNQFSATDFSDSLVFPNEYTGTEDAPCVGGWILRPDEDFKDTYFVEGNIKGRSYFEKSIYLADDDLFAVCGICPAIVVNSPTVE